jgi:ferritin-like metal-binding protein YciE
MPRLQYEIYTPNRKTAQNQLSRTPKRFKHSNNKSKFAQHLVENKHAIRRMIDIMEIVYIKKTWKIMDTLESLHM